LIIFSTDFDSGLTRELSGALLDIEGAESVEITNSNFYKNEGAPVIRAVNTDIKIVGAEFR
jgi:hypothetical protein